MDIKWKDCAPGTWVNIYDNSSVLIVERHPIPGFSASDLFEIKFDEGDLFLSGISSSNINDILSKKDYPELYL